MLCDDFHPFESEGEIYLAKDAIKKVSGYGPVCYIEYEIGERGAKATIKHTLQELTESLK